MTKDEKVNGPRIAAQILSRMNSSNREKIFTAIAKADPGIAGKITKNMSTFNDVAELTSQGLQILIKAVEHKDLVVSLKTAAENVKAALFANMSERKKQVVNEDFAALPPVKISDIEEAQRRIINKMDELKTLGLIHSTSSTDSWA